MTSDAKTCTAAPRLLAGRYTLGEVVGRGGMADVHLGRDTRTGGPVAVKLLRSHLSGDPFLRSCLSREAELLRHLRHPGVVTVLDAGVEGVGAAGGDSDAPAGWRGAPFLVLEHVAGSTLRDVLRAGLPARGTAVRYVMDVLAALEACHRAGVVHRDLKPANIMVTPDGAVKIIDFGIACTTGGSTAADTLVLHVRGTPAYLSPEQARGEATDPRSDLYSVGCLLFELLTGRPPFTGDDPVLVAYQHVYQDAPGADTGNPSIDSLVAKALAKDPDQRFQSAGAFGEALCSAARALSPQPRELTAC